MFHSWHASAAPVADTSFFDLRHRSHHQALLLPSACFLLHAIMNGTSTSNSNGHTSAPSPAPSSSIPSSSAVAPATDPTSLTPLGLNRQELVRLLVQSMDSLGYSQSARSLEKEAGVQSMTSDMRTLRDCILNGHWDILETVLDSLNVFKSEKDANSARFVLYEQKFLELLEARKTAEALNCLRNHLTRLSPDPKLFNKLPLLCLCATPDEVREHAGWPGAGMVSRLSVLKKLYKFIPSYHLLQENRLESLLWQTLDVQKRKTMFPYTKQKYISLLEDMEHSNKRVPRSLLFKLHAHTDEVWYVQFSHSGDYLASASKDTCIIIWDIQSLLLSTSSNLTTATNNINCDEEFCKKYILKKLQGHTETISCLSWSPRNERDGDKSDKRLLSCGYDKTIRLWNVETGECTRVFEGHTKEITACKWLPDGIHFISGSADKKIYEWDSRTGTTTSTYEANAHVNDLTLSKDGLKLIATSSDYTIQIFNTETKKEEIVMKECVSVTCLYLSNMNNDHLLVVTNNGNEVPEIKGAEIHVWRLSDQSIIERFKGFKQSRYVIRGCFAGFEGMFVICGSEDCLVYVWERGTGQLINRLEGHQGTVNTVAVSEADDHLFASGSDDKSIIIWGVVDQDRQGVDNKQGDDDGDVKFDDRPHDEDDEEEDDDNNDEELQ